MCRLRIVYLVAVSLAIFLVHDPRFLGAVLLVHLAVVPFAGVPWKRLGGIFWRLRFFFLFLIVAQGLFPPKSHFLLGWLEVHLPDLCRMLAGHDGSKAPHRPGWALGVATGLYQVSQVFAMVLVSTIVRSSGGGRGFLNGLRGFFLPDSTIKIIDTCLGHLEKETGQGKPAPLARPENDPTGEQSDTPSSQHRGTRTPIRALLRGDAGWVLDQLEGRLDRDLSEPATCSSSVELDDDVRDVNLMTRIALVLMSLRMLKITPGTGLTPGHQNLIVLPLLCLAADRTRRRWGATVVGTSAGLLSVMLGLGKNGIFILPAQMLPGVLVDLGWPFFRATTLRRFPCMILGAVAGLGRFTGMLLVLLLLDNAELLAAVPFLSLGHVCFGFLSGTVTYSLIRQSREREKKGQVPL